MTTVTMCNIIFQYPSYPNVLPFIFAQLLNCYTDKEKLGIVSLISYHRNKKYRNNGPRSPTLADIPVDI